MQKLRKTPRRIDTFGVANPLTGLLYCADCGEKMYNHRSRGNPDKGKNPSDFFDCSTYTLSRQKRNKACCGHYITTKALNTLILETIRAAGTYAVNNQDEFLENVRAASQIRQQDAAKEAKRKLSKDRKRRDELDGIIKKLYESFALGRISEERFDSLLSDYEEEQKALIASVMEAEEHLTSFEEDSARAEQFLFLAKKYTDFSELTTPMINEFIEKIIVHAPEKVDGDREQEVEIYLSFIGRFELPPVELAPEEVKRQEQLKRRRIRYRERYQQIKAGERVPGQPITLTCKHCGKDFAARNSNAMFCSRSCQSKHHREETSENRRRECICENCGTEFTTTKKNVKYCCVKCREKAKYKRERQRSQPTESEASDPSDTGKNSILQTVHPSRAWRSSRSPGPFLSSHFNSN